MKFKNWREAEKRAAELKTELEAINKTIETDEATARAEDLDVEKRDALIATIQGNVAKRDALQAEHDDAVKAGADLKDAETRQFGLLDNVSTQRIAKREERNRDMDKTIYETRDYEIAWGKSVLTGKDTELRSLINTQDDSHAGYLIPTRLANSIKENVFTGGRILGLCNFIEGKGDLEQPYLNSETEPEVHPEKSTTDKTEKAIEFAIRSIRTEIIAEWIPVSRKFENNDGGLFFDWLMIKLPRAIVKKQESLLLSGAANGSDGLRGILNDANERFVASVQRELTFNTANEAVALLDDGVEDGAVVVLNRQTFFKDIMGLKGTDDHPIFTIMTDNLGRPSFRVGGYPAIFNNDIPEYGLAAEGDPYMLVGNFNGYTIQYPAGMNPTILRDPYSAKKKNIVEYLCELECGGNVLELGHFVKVIK